MPLLNLISVNDTTEMVIWQVHDLEVEHYLKSLNLDNEGFILKSQKRKKEWVGIYNCLLALNLPTIIYKHSNGKPFVKTNDYISISHSMGVVCVAKSSNSYIGIDIEKINKKILKIKNKFVNQEEDRYVNEDKLLETLTSIWCIKESVYKIFSSKSFNFKNDIITLPLKFNFYTWGRCKVIIKEKEIFLATRLFNLDSFIISVVIHNA